MTASLFLTRRLARLSAAGLLLAAACTSETPSPTKKADAKAEAPAQSQPPVPNFRAELAAQARHLSRLPVQPGKEPTVVAGLSRLLFTGGETTRWAALGLGRRCQGELGKPGQSISAAAAALAAKASQPNSEVLLSLGWALGSCGTAQAEDSLRSWLSPPPHADFDDLIVAGAVGLSALADRRGRLSERTQAALLDAAARERNPQLLQPLGRLRRLDDAISARLLDVAGELLTGAAGPARREVVLALGSSGAGAAAPLGQVLLSDDFSIGERSAAAKALGRMGNEGQRALDSVVRDLLERGLPMEATSLAWPPLRSALEALQEPRKARQQLRELSTVVLPEGKSLATDAQGRRLIWLRCRAADLLAQASSRASGLLACDPDDGEAFELAQLRVLDRGAISGARFTEFQRRMESSHPRVLLAALRLLAAHSEIEEPAQFLKAALQADSMGAKTAAAQLIAAYPSRAHTEEGTPDADVVSALTDLLQSDSPRPPETVAAALRAAGALGALTLKPLVLHHCEKGRASLRDPARRALALLGSPKKLCPLEEPATEESEAPSTAANAALSVHFSSPVGPLVLHLDEDFASASRQRVTELVEAGFYNEIRIHGVSAGFAVQLGDPNGDGYPDRVHASLPNEISPTPFGPLSIGMSAFAEGEQDAQLFVSLGGAPQLIGRRVQLGRAEGHWELLVVGDQLGKAKITH